MPIVFYLLKLCVSMIKDWQPSISATLTVPFLARCIVQHLQSFGHARCNDLPRVVEDTACLGVNGLKHKTCLFSLEFLLGSSTKTM